MRRIKKILRVEDRGSYKRTHAIVTDKLGNEEEAVAFGDGFEVGDRVEFFFDERWNTIKFRKGVDKSIDNTLQ